MRHHVGTIRGIQGIGVAGLAMHVLELIISDATSYPLKLDKKTSAWRLTPIALVRNTNAAWCITPMSSHTYISVQMFAYAGVENHTECRCGQVFGGQGNDSTCNYTCSGDPGQICGGYVANIILPTSYGMLLSTFTFTCTSR